MVVRCAAAVSLVTAALVAVAATPALSEPAALPAPPATVKLVDCSRDTHAATFRGRMKAVADSERMGMRFTLFEKGAAGFEALAAPGLARWHKSRPGVAAFGYRQTVRGLQPGASYRMQVNYRWYSADGRLIARARRRSPVCRQFEQLPNLIVAVEDARKTKVDGVLRYGVRVSNTGVAPAGGVAVRMAVDGGVLDTITIGLLASGESRLLGFRGPSCTSSVSAAVDPDGVLMESSEDDNVHELSCADLPGA
jgi:hypothetical protein